eukprot:scaffold4921_cov80-Isochrysis_galbana.AAC.1
MSDRRLRLREGAPSSSSASSSGIRPGAAPSTAASGRSTPASSGSKAASALSLYFCANTWSLSTLACMAASEPVRRPGGVRAASAIEMIGDAAETARSAAA